jgi:cellobiose phosphorylase
VGASSAPEGKIHLNAQTWSILAEVAPQDRAAKAWSAVKANLLTEYGPLLVHPAYTVPDTSIGYITRYSPGSRENGGVYMHAATWALAAACKVKDQATVERIWNSVSPPTRSADGRAYYAEPYVLPGNVDGPLSDKPGRAGWTWYTGSAAWLNRVSLEWVLGIRPTWGGLTIDPCPPAALGKVSVSRVYRGVRVNVVFDAAEYASGKRPQLVVDGRVLGEGVATIEPEMISAAGRAGKEVCVEVKWGIPAAAGSVEVKPAGKTVGV